MISTASDIIVPWAGQTTEDYFQPAICKAPDGRLMLLMQAIKASDAFGPPSCAFSADDGATWCAPSTIPSLATRCLADRAEEGIADVRPYYHPLTGTVLAVGCNTFYHRSADGALVHDRTGHHADRRQHPVYTVYSGDGNWSARQSLSHPFFADCANWRIANFQMVIKADGSLLIPVYFRPAGQGHYAVCTIHCSFDGRRLGIESVGDTLSLPSHDLGESSLAWHDGRYHLTLRALDGHGYHAASHDGLAWGRLACWSWEDGELLTMSATQQHWLATDERLHLLYTRRTPENAEVFRYRAPLFIAEVDAERGRIKRHTEQIVFPHLRRDGCDNHFGNFHAIVTEPGIAWVSDAPLWFRIEKAAKPEDDHIVGFRTEVWLKKFALS